MTEWTTDACDGSSGPSACLRESAYHSRKFTLGGVTYSFRKHEVTSAKSRMGVDWLLNVSFQVMECQKVTLHSTVLARFSALVDSMLSGEC